MLFNSYLFILLFLPLVLVACSLVIKNKGTPYCKYVILGASFLFLTYGGFYHTLVFIGSILMNYFIRIRIVKSADQAGRKGWLIAGLIGNIALLGYFKYTCFLIENINALFHTRITLIPIILPLGISFYTFLQIAYLVDVYRGDIHQNETFTDYALFVSFFPKLIQGPIVSHHELMPQFDHRAPGELSENIAQGLYLFTIGLSKKVLLADLFGKIVNYGYSSISALNAFEAVLVIVGYTLQIYFDFSGYCDMAAGVAKMFNIDLPWNFESPYKALDIQDFWNRWHITLTCFLTKYIYIPLGGNRKGTLRTYLNVFLVFLISGLWHGAGYTFVVWGIMHGIVSILFRIFKTSFHKIHQVIRWLITFVFVNIAWVFFRAESVVEAAKMIKQVFIGGFSISINPELSEILLQPALISIGARMIPLSILMVIVYLMTLLIVIGHKNSREMLSNFKPSWKSLGFTLFLLVYSLLSLSGVSAFLYTNF